MAGERNSTYFNSVNRVLREEGKDPILTEDAFNSGAVDRVQLQAILFYDHCNRMAARRLNKLFTNRVFTFNTVEDQADYELDELTHLEGIRFHSVRCNTTGAARPLNNIPYDEYRDSLYPDLSLVPSGKPTDWVACYSNSAMGTERGNKIKISPVPDGIYEIEFIAKIVVPPLLLAADFIYFPPEYEDVMWTWTQNWLRQKLGKDASMDDYAREAIDSVRAWGTAPPDVRQAARINIRIGGGRRTSYKYDTPDYRAGW